MWETRGAYDVEKYFWEYFSNENEKKASVATDLFAQLSIEEWKQKLIILDEKNQSFELYFSFRSNIKC